MLFDQSINQSINQSIKIVVAIDRSIHRSIDRSINQSRSLLDYLPLKKHFYYDRKFLSAKNDLKETWKLIFEVIYHMASVSFVLSGGSNLILHAHCLPSKKAGLKQ